MLKDQRSMSRRCSSGQQALLISSNTSSLSNSSYRFNETTCMRMSPGGRIPPVFLALRRSCASLLRCRRLWREHDLCLPLIITHARPCAPANNLHGLDSSTCDGIQTAIAGVLALGWLLNTISTTTGCRAPSRHRISQQATRLAGGVGQTVSIG